MITLRGRLDICHITELAGGEETVEKTMHALCVELLNFSSKWDEKSFTLQSEYNILFTADGIVQQDIQPPPTVPDNLQSPPISPECELRCPSPIADRGRLDICNITELAGGKTKVEEAMHALWVELLNFSTQHGANEKRAAMLTNVIEHVSSNIERRAAERSTWTSDCEESSTTKIINSSNGKAYRP